MDIFRVHFQNEYSGEFISGLKSMLDPGIVLTSGDEDPGEFRLLVAGRPERELLDSSEGLEALLIPWAGLPLTTAEILEDYPHVNVYNIHHNAGAAAEMAVALMMAAAKRVVPAHNSLCRGDWSIRYTPESSILVSCSEVLVLGMGSIGRRVADVCRTMGASVKGIRLHAVPGDRTSGIYPPSCLHDLLPETDILVVCLPLTRATRGMIGEVELALLPSHAVLVNVARGEVICEEPLYRHLATCSVGAAGIDVWYSYPGSIETRKETPPSEYPFHELENVVMSPHRGGAFGVAALETMRIEHLAEAINSLAAGEEPPGRVDLQLGY